VFEKVLIANRGEIACRAIRTLRQMGLGSVAVYAPADASSLHVRDADVAVPLGGGPPRENYLESQKLLAVASAHGAGAVFPGYGFLSENAEFADQCEAAGVAFIGPTSDQLRAFGLKHRARELAQAAGVPLLPGSELLRDLQAALTTARSIGYPVMLKSTAGGGGIGLTLCHSEAELIGLFDSAVRLSQNNFAQGGVFLEKFVARARHIEVQIFGDGSGGVVALGERDCSAQRRNQKVIEETPAPGLTNSVREALRTAALCLAKSLNYRSAGTVEFIYDVGSSEFYFLEVNTRLQVEHGVTEQVTGVDLVRWMIETAQGNPPKLADFTPKTLGHSIQARVYAEIPAKDFRPSSGLLTHAKFPAGPRVDTWVESGVEISPFYDPLLAKVIVTAETRAQAIAGLASALTQTELCGVETNLRYLSEILDSEEFASGAFTTQSLKHHVAQPHGIEVLAAGTFSTVQDYPGRTGYWNVGVPPSGPMDSLALRLGNGVVGNAPGTAALEMTLTGVTLRFAEPCTVCLSGADMQAQLDGVPIERYTPIEVPACAVLELGKVEGPGARAYLCVRGGFDVPSYLGSRSTFTLGRFGGHGGRTLQLGDVLYVGVLAANDDAPATNTTTTGTAASFGALPEAAHPTLTSHWQLRVLYGPHGAPDFFTEADIATFFATDWEVHYNSARTGVRLLGPKPKWARPDGGEAGLHPSNIHDNAYAFGTVDYTGDMPIILGPDGPSLGGFVCPATVIAADLWKVGQMRPGERVRFERVSPERASALEREQLAAIATARAGSPAPRAAGGVDATTDDGPRRQAQPSQPAEVDSARLMNIAATTDRPEVCYRPAGDKFLLVEYGPMVLDLNLRFRVHALDEWLRQHGPPGILETTGGIRSLQIHYDSLELSRDSLLACLIEAEQALPETNSLQVPTRIVHLPLSWDDEATQLAIQKYSQLVRKDAPWAPSNIEFIRRINGLESTQDVQRTVFDASYLVLGLGDVYLGAPVATPLDPRHRLVTTKYNPARTWTPENAVGIGGAYLCIYGMEGPGGYQFVGRTLQVYNRFRVTRDFEANKPWLLRLFDQIRFFPVSGAELLELRDAFSAGRYELQIEHQIFDLGRYNRFLNDNAAEIGAFRTQQQAAFEAERQRWVANGQLHFADDAGLAPADEDALPEGWLAVPSPVPGSVWKIEVTQGARVELGDKLLILESMKMEMTVDAPVAGLIRAVRATEGATVQAGQILIVIEP
jgi:urea carboxylase